MSLQWVWRHLSTFCDSPLVAAMQHTGVCPFPGLSNSMHRTWAGLKPPWKDRTEQGSGSGSAIGEDLLKVSGWKIGKEGAVFVCADSSSQARERSLKNDCGEGGAGLSGGSSPDANVPMSTKLSIAGVGMLSFIGILTETSLNVTFPRLQKEFGEPLSTVQLLTSGYLLMVTLMMSASAYLMKRFDARVLFRTASVLCLVGVVLCSLPGTGFWVLLSGRLLQAMATGISTPLMINLILSLVPINRRGAYMGIANMITSFAPALGPTYGGTINNFLQWRAIFAGLVPLILVAWVIGECNVRLEASGKRVGGGSSFDGLGLVLLCFAMLGITQIFDQISVSGGWSSHVAIAIAVAVVALFLFVWRCLAARSPLLDLRILKKPIVALRGCNYFILQFVNIGCSFMLPVFAENFLHVDSMAAGLMLLPGSLLGAVMAPIAGRLYDRHGPARILSASNVLVLLGAVAMYLLAGNAGIVLIGFLYAFLRLGFNLGYGNTMSDASKFVEPARQTDFNPLFNVLQQYAGSLGTTVFSMSLSISTIHMPGNVAVANLVGARHAFLLVVAVGVVAVCLTFVSIRVRPSLGDQVRSIQV